MLAQPCDSFLDDEFGRPVESIMRCEDFKSNFARRLSNRFIARTSVSGARPDGVLKLCPAEKQEILNKVPERIEPCSQLSKSNHLDKGREIVKSPDKAINNNTDMRLTEVNALNMEVDTLRWQLAQTEANRQMHIALLKQIVTFLNRVKEHIESQKNESEIQLDEMSPMVLSKPVTISELPRSRSVLHVSKNLDCSISSTKKMSTRKISKSINNVNGYRDCSSIWSQSKLSFVTEDETGQKLSEEMSRLITLANTVLSTKLPDLACACVCNRPKSSSSLQLPDESKKEEETIQNETDSLKLDLNSTIDNIVLITNCSSETHNGITNKFEDVKNKILNDFIVSQSPLCFGLKNDSSGTKLFEQETPVSQCSLVTSCGNLGQAVDKRSDYNASSNFIEDESGFSSMNSFQEIGIPIISIIPPSPSKEVEYLEDIAAENEKWKADDVELDSQSVKVFWV